MDYLAELKRWNKTHNLTAIRSDDDVVVKHFLDSALFLKALDKCFPAGAALRIADVGSGAGFPGIPLKLLRPALDVALIEPRLKKAVFLRHIGSRLRLAGTEAPAIRVEVIEARAEDVPATDASRAAGFDAALTRALFSPAEFVKKAGHLVRPGGFFIMSKGPAYKEELGDLSYEDIALKLPFSDAERHLIMIKNKPEG